MLALHALGALGALESTQLAEEQVYVPNHTRHAIYQAAIARQAWLYERLIDGRYNARSIAADCE